MERYSYCYDSPVGILNIQASDEGITGISFEENVFSGSTETTDEIEKCVAQFNEYFMGKRKYFDLKLIPEGTLFQKQVWEELLKVPYGETASYKDIAVRINNPKAVRAVGGANNKNKIAIIIPCHRIIGKNGELVGYGGKLWRKEKLLELEKRWI